MIAAWEVLHGGEVREGVPVHDDGTIHVGEAGRGRELRRVAVPAALMRDGRLHELPGEGRALLLIRDQSGYRGRWYPAELCPGGAPAPGDALTCSLCGALLWAPWAEGPHPRRGADAPYPLRDEGVRVLAEGLCAQGDAGRMGCGREYLLTVPIGWTAHLWREGRLYGGAPVLRLTVEPDGSAGCYDLRHDVLPLEVAP